MCPWFSRSFGTGGTTKTRIVPTLRGSVFLFYKNKKCNTSSTFSIQNRPIPITQEKLTTLKKESQSTIMILIKTFTKITDDWELILVFKCTDRSEALYLESFIKRMKSKVFIEKIISNPKILEDILSKKK